jgi:hypothetical protein
VILAVLVEGDSDVVLEARVVGSADEIVDVCTSNEAAVVDGVVGDSVDVGGSVFESSVVATSGLCVDSKASPSVVKEVVG